MSKKWAPVKGGSGALVMGLFLLMLNPFFIVLAMVIAVLFLLYDKELAEWQKTRFRITLVILFLMLIFRLSWIN